MISSKEYYYKLDIGILRFRIKYFEVFQLSNVTCLRIKYDYNGKNDFANAENIFVWIIKIIMYNTQIGC